MSRETSIQQKASSSKEKSSSKSSGSKSSGSGGDKEMMDFRHLMVKGLELKKSKGGASEKCVIYMDVTCRTFFCAKQKNASNAKVSERADSPVVKVQPVAVKSGEPWQRRDADVSLGVCGRGV